MLKALAALLVTTLALPTVAQTGYPDAYALRPLELPPSMVQVKIPLIIDLSHDNAGKVVFIPFDLRFGVTRELELRVFHPVHGLCLRGCDPKYNDIALGMLLSVFEENGLEASLLGALEFRSLTSPVGAVLDAGMAFKLIRAPFSIFAAPYVGIPLSDRDHLDDWVNVPVEFAFQLSPPTALFVETGLYGNAHDPGSWSGPVGVGINQLLHHDVDLGAEFKLNSVIGNPDAGNRLVLVYLTLRG
jgi:hypothetical protein